MNGEGPRPTTKTAKPEDAKPIDEAARQEFEKLPNVTEVYPQVRFLTEVRFNGASYSTNVLALPDSARASGTFDGIIGKAFSSPTAEEAILQTEFAKELSPQPASLVGKEIDAALCAASRNDFGGRSQRKRHRQADGRDDVRGHLDRLAREETAHRRNYRHRSFGGNRRLWRRARVHSAARRGRSSCRAARRRAGIRARWRLEQSPPTWR